MDGFPDITFPSERLRFRITRPKQRELSKTPPDTEVSFVPMAAISEFGLMDVAEIKFLEDVKAGYTYFRNGDVVIAKITPCFENGKGAIARNLLNGIGFGTTELFVLRPSSSVDERFLYYFTVSQYFRGVGTGLMYGAGGQKRIPDSLMLDVPFPAISLSQQALIADFLDRETAEADALIAKYERLIKVLQEKRVALITHVVTKGLDSSVAIKDSGIAWSGDIPREWQIRPLKHLFRFEKGKNAQHLTSEYIQANPGEYPVYSGQTENNGVMGSIDTFDYDVTEVLFSTTVGAKVMTPLTLRGRFSLSQNCLIGIPKDRSTSTDFFYYALHPLFAYHRASIPDHMQPSLRVADIANFYVVVPNSLEQKLIVDYLKKADCDIQTLIDKSRSAIQLIQERRSSLITAAVTGQIDVSTYRSKKQQMEVPA